MRPHPAVLGLLEDEGEGVVELLAGAKPDELAFAHVDVGLKDVREGGPRARIEAIGGDHQIVFRHQGFRIVDLGVEDQLDAEVAGAALQQQ